MFDPSPLVIFGQDLKPSDRLAIENCHSSDVLVRRPAFRTKLVSSELSALTCVTLEPDIIALWGVALSPRVTKDAELKCFGE